MGALIWLIIIGFFIYKSVKKNPELEKQLNEAKEKAMRENRPAPPRQATPPRPVAARKQATTSEVAAVTRTATMETAQTRMPEIVTRAKENSARYADLDITLEELETEHEHSEHVSPAGGRHGSVSETKKAHTAPENVGSFIEEEDILGSVEDLMVKGYDGNLSFERDFVGEAMDMINTFTLIQNS
jgi:hypothetical protein